MRSLRVVFLLGLSTFTSTPYTGWARSEHHQAVTDPFEIFRTMDYAYAMFDMDRDGDLDCSVATRTELNEQEQSATYIWELTGPDGEARRIQFHYVAIPGSDQATVTIGEGDAPPITSKFLYADSSCVIEALPLFRRPECFMGVPEEVKTNVSESCINQFEKNCHTIVRGFDETSCSKWVNGKEDTLSH
ncbi:uncharacterized protein LOC144167338 [Haemaphysalis longicornis]